MQSASANYSLLSMECSRSGGAERPVRAGVVPNASLKGRRPSENAKMPERAWEKKSGK
jgi:hypothetical protein